MGTDIHGRVQRRWSPEAKYEDVGGIEDDRNYLVFAMLAGVRNGVGFAGVKTHEPLVPVSEPRGLPDDLDIIDEDSVVVPAWIDGNRKIDAHYWLGDHSHSWLTLKEIADWAGWGKSLAMTGIIERAEYERIQREGGNPNSWCGGISGPGVKIVSADTAKLGGDFTHVNWSWCVPFFEYTATFRAWVDYLLAKYGYMIERDPAAIRIVFGFDS
jgi:hypothetical protein